MKTKKFSHKFSNLKGDDEDFLIPKMLDPDAFEKHYVWVTKFDDDALRKFYDAFMMLERDPAVDVIPVIVSSYGGYCDVLTSMRDLIKSSPKPVATIATGKAMSCGVCLTAAGTKGLRFSAPGTRFMIHEISGAEWGKNEDVQVGAREMQRLNRLFMTNLAEDMGKTYSWLMNELHKRKNTDWFLNASQAKAVGIVDQIGQPRVNHTTPETVMHTPPSFNEMVKQGHIKKKGG